MASSSSDEESDSPPPEAPASNDGVSHADQSAQAATAPEEDDAEIGGFQLVTRKRLKIASIVIDAASDTVKLLDELSTLLGTTLEGRFEQGKLRVFPKTIDEHRKLQNYLSVKKMRSHTFEMADTKQLKAVIRGLPPDYDQKDLATELSSYNLTPSHISILRKRISKEIMPLFLVVLPKTEEAKDIFQIKHLGSFRVDVEPLNKTKMPPQCYRCQEFFHHSRLCNRAPRCVKCGGGHLTADCKKPDSSPAKCANCRGPHPANFSECPSNPNMRKQNKQQPLRNAWSKPLPVRAASKTTTPPQRASPAAPTFTPNAPFDANMFMQQMAQMMTQWGSMLTAIQTYTNK